MKSLGLARRVAALGATTAVLATMVAGLMSGSAQAATSVTAGKATQSAATSKPKVAVSTPVVSDKHYWGGCPTTVKFSAKVKVKLTGGKTTLAYRWLHGDGSKSKVYTIGLKGKGTKSVTVKQALTFHENVKGWEALQVLGPRKVTSKKAYFQVECTNGMPTHPSKPAAWAKAWAHPDEYVGPCTPGDKIDFTGVIKVADPRWVKYRWVLNGRVVDAGAVKVYDSRKVGFGFSPRESHRGSAVLELVGENARDSNRVYYKVWCKDAPPAPVTKVSVSDLVPGSNHASCPTGKVGAVAKITSTGSGRVTYTFSIDGKTHSGAVYFREAGSKHVSMPETAVSEPTKNGTVRISVSGSNNSDSVSQSYTAPCEVSVPLTVSVSASAAQDDCAAGATPSGKITGSVTVSGTGTYPVQVEVKLGQDKFQTLTFAQSGTQSFSAQSVSGESGSKLVVAAGPSGLHGEQNVAWKNWACPKSA